MDEGFLAGSAAGAVLLASGVHLGNGRHGIFYKDLLTSVLVGGLGVVLIGATTSEFVVVVVPIAQLIATVSMERKETPYKKPD